MPRPPPRRARLLALLLLAACALQGARVLLCAAPTYDEVSYLGTGLHILKNGGFDVPGGTVHPPLSFWLHALPLLGERFPEKVFDHDRSLRSVADWTTLPYRPRGVRMLLCAEGGPASLIARARAPLLATSLLLGAGLFLWTRRLFGDAAGLAALFCFAFEPNLLAHGVLITPDGPFAAAAFLTIAAFHGWMDRPSPGRAALAGLLLGAAFLSKVPAALLPPGLLVLFWIGRPGGMAGGRRPLGFLGVLAVGVLAAGAGAGFDLEAVSGWFRHLWRLADEPRRSYLLGTVREGGTPLYHAVALLIKTPIPLLVLAAAGAGAIWRKGPPTTDDRPPPTTDDGRRTAAAFLLLPPAALLAALTLFHPVNIGVRYLLPAFPFLCVLAGAAFRDGPRFLSARGLAGAALLAWLAAGTLRAMPDPLSYFNEAAGGPEGGIRRLAESNLDWGQDLFRLAEEARRRSWGHVHLAYFGSMDPFAPFQEGGGPSPRVILLPGAPDTDPSAPPLIPARGFFAISASHLAGVGTKDPDAYGRFRRVRPIGTAGRSIYLFSLPSEELEEPWLRVGRR